MKASNNKTSSRIPSSKVVPPPASKSSEAINAVESEPTKYRVLLVDDHPVVRTGLQMVIQTQPDLESCGGMGTVADALVAVGREKPDLVITDLSLPGRGGIELIKDLLALYPKVRVLVCSMHDQLLYAERCLKAGAKGYIMKESSGQDLLAAIRTIAKGSVWVSPRLGSKIIGSFAGTSNKGAHSPMEKLTDREFDVFRHFGDGKTTKEIAETLHLSPKTVAVHRDNIKTKLDIYTTAELLRYAIRWVESQGSANDQTVS